MGKLILKFVISFIGLILLILVTVQVTLYFNSRSKTPVTSVLNLLPIAKPTPLAAYTFPALSQSVFSSSQITFGAVLKTTPTTRTQMFYFETPIYPGSKDMKHVSGVANLPKAAGAYPVIVMFRGFVPTNIYSPGVGTQPVANQFAEHGLITLAPDFLGYGQSDATATDPFESRFQTYTTALSLLASLPTLNTGLGASYSGKIQADLTRTGVWGHSNGGNITLSVAAITGNKYPTVVWAPVSKSFPYSILYYTDEADDQGKSLRQLLSNFELTYDVNLYSPPKYFGQIRAPFHVDQGSLDPEVPLLWTTDLVSNLKKAKLDISFSVYSGADHNLAPKKNWDKAVQTDLDFYTTQFKK